MIAFLVVLFLAWRYPAGDRRDSRPRSTASIRGLTGYFLFLFQALKYFPGSLESVAAVVLHGACDPDPAGGAFLRSADAPTSAGPPDRHRPCDLRAGRVLALTFIGALAGCSARMCQTCLTVAEGHRMYHELNCAYCTSVNGRGADRADLMLSRSSKDQAWKAPISRNRANVVQQSASVAIDRNYCR